MTKTNAPTTTDAPAQDVLRFPRVDRDDEDELDYLPWRHKPDDWWRAHAAKVGAERAATERAAREIEAAGRGALLRSAGFPGRAVDAALEPSGEAPTSLTLAREYVAAGRRSVLVLAGGTGTGKTTAATWAAFSPFGGLAPGFIRAAELEARGRHDKKLRPLIRSCSMLVLDDLGAEVLDTRGAFRSLLDEVIDALYADRRRLVITTNLLARRRSVDDEPQFVERYGERAMSRLREVGVWGECGNHDLRGASRGT